MMGSTALWAVRLGLVVVGLAGWFWTQRLIARRAWPERGIGDAMHLWTAALNRYLRARPATGNALMIATSAVIDGLGLFLLASAIFGPTIRPFLGLLIVYVLRQVSQGLCSLPQPDGMIWRHPGFPSLLVTYGTAGDLFFSGHTAIAVYGFVAMVRLGGPALPPPRGGPPSPGTPPRLRPRAPQTLDTLAAPRAPPCPAG